MSIQTTIARPYAKAAFALACEHHDIAAWTTFLQTAAWVVQQPKVKRYLLNPRRSATQRYEWLLTMCEPIAVASGRNFLKLLADKNRLMLLPEIAELFETYRIEQEKIVIAQVTSAYPLTTAEEQRLTAALKIKLQREVTLKTALDKNILGGIIIRAGDLVIDSSVRSKLTRLETELTN